MFVARYQNELAGVEAEQLAERFYHQALSVAPHVGERFITSHVLQTHFPGNEQRAFCDYIFRAVNFKYVKILNDIYFDLLVSYRNAI